MEIESFAKLFLAHWIIEHFDIVKGIADPAKERIDIWLDEKKQVPTDYYAEHEVIAYGFTKESVVQDFPDQSEKVVGGRGIWDLCLSLWCR